VSGGVFFSATPQREEQRSRDGGNESAMEFD